MSKYTMTLYEYVDFYGEDSLFNFEYPIFDEGYRASLEQIIFDYYAFREISIIPPERWHHVFKTRFKLLMGEMNELYKTQLIKFNPMLTECMEISNERKDGTKQLSNFGSLLSAGERARKTNSNIHDIIRIGNLDKTIDTTEDEENSTDGTLKDTTKEKTNSTLDKELFTNETYQETDDTTTQGDKAVTGEITRQLENSGESTSTNNKIVSDYPQANLSATPPENPGQWASGSQNDTGSGTTKGQETETTKTQEDTDYSEDKERTIDGSKEKTETGQERLDKTVDTERNQVSHGDFVGNIVGSNTTEQKTKDTENLDEHLSETSSNSRDSQLATSENRIREFSSDEYKILSGHRNISPSKLIAEWRSIILNVDMEIIRRLETLFMGVW